MTLWFVHNALQIKISKTSLQSCRLWNTIMDILLFHQSSQTEQLPWVAIQICSPSTLEGVVWRLTPSHDHRLLQSSQSEPLADVFRVGGRRSAPGNSSTHDTLSQRWFDVGPPSATLAQHQTNIGSKCRVCWYHHRLRSGPTSQTLDCLRHRLLHANRDCRYVSCAVNSLHPCLPCHITHQSQPLSSPWS